MVWRCLPLPDRHGVLSIRTLQSPVPSYPTGRLFANNPNLRVPGVIKPIGCLRPRATGMVGCGMVGLDAFQCRISGEYDAAPKLDQSLLSASRRRITRPLHRRAASDAVQPVSIGLTAH